MARRRSGKAAQAGSRKRGRTPGTWNLTNPREMLEYRKTQKVSRARLADVLGVSPTSVQNWETGRVVATTPIQMKLADLMKDGSVIPPPSRRGRGPSGDDGHGSPEIATTATIVTSYLATLSAPMTQEELVALIREVRRALA